MLKKIHINGKNKLAFILKDGPAATIVIPIETLLQVDYNRLKKMDAEGGELMAVMRETKLENGMNALDMYQSLIHVIRKHTKPANTGEGIVDKEEQKKVLTGEKTEETTQKEQPKKKRGPGRPRKKKD